MSADAVPGITAIGEGTVQVRPDRAIVLVGAMVRAGTAEEAQRQVAERIARVRERASRLGVATGDIKHGGYEIHPAYAHGPMEPRSDGYQVSQQLILTLHDVERVGAALDALVATEGATTASVRFSLSDERPAEAEARR
jgi:uncharacterized protein YggE